MGEDADTMTMAAEITAAWLSNPHTRATADEAATLFTTVHQAVGELGQPAGSSADVEAQTTYEPAVSARKSLASPDHIVSMIDGKKYRSLKRHLTSNGLTPAQYRERYKLKADYPMVAPGYSEARRALAKTLGLGRKAGEKVEKAAEGAVKTARKSGRAALAAAKKALGTDDG